MRFYNYLIEASYIGNVGFMEMVKFYKKATKEQIKEMEKAVDKADWNEYKKIIKKVIGVDLK